MEQRQFSPRNSYTGHLECSLMMSLSKSSCGKTTRCSLRKIVFRLLYELLDTILRRETERALDEFEATGSWEECMITASRFAREHKRAVYHIYTSSHRLELEKHVDRISGEMMHSYVEAQAHGLRVSEADKKLVCDLYRFGITDIFYEWLENGMKEDLEAQIRRLSLLFTGNIRASLSRVQIPAES